jgi:hypothetical protein
LTGDFELMDVANGFFMVKFDLKQDKAKVITEGGWFDHYLTISHWSVDFVSSSAKLHCTMVWIRIPNLNLVFYDENLLMVMTLTGKPIKEDMHTRNVERQICNSLCCD